MFSLRFVLVSLFVGLSILLLVSLFSIDNYVDSQLLNGWKNYTSEKLGISFEIPNNWEVKEKVSRFDDGPDLTARNGMNSLSITMPIPNDPSYMSELETFSNLWSPNYDLSGDYTKIRDIEGFDFNKYRIDDKETSSALFVIEPRSGERLVNQIFLIKTDTGIYELNYRDTPARFDTSESQDKLNHILQSFKFLKPDIVGLISNLTTSLVPTAKPIGNENAVINIVEFGDYQDPFSARFNQETKDELVSKFVDTGIVRFGFKDLVINDSPKDKLSTLGAEASYCAAEQDKYWDYHDEVYKNSKGENTGWLSNASLVGFAKNVNVTDIAKFTECLNSHKYNQQVSQNDAFAKSLGLASTPTFLILMENSTKIAAVEGAQPFNVFDDVIAQFLNGTI
ncbi:MAG TPA: thioredoxin domain-containing protein [Nitrososphaeraceae archaeon]|nr:thioredoxin domain-containing protein [Nitrososphaeraceae archaeon]